MNSIRIDNICLPVEIYICKNSKIMKKKTSIENETSPL